MLELAVNYNAERSVLGAILLHPITVADVGDVVQPADFHHPANRAIFEAIMSLIADNRPVDLVTVTAELKAAETLDQLKAVGGEDYLIELQSCVASIENVRYHAGVIADRSRRRRITAQLGALHTQSYSAMADAEFFAAVDKAIAEMTAHGSAANGPLEVPKVMRQVIADLKDKYERRQRGENLDIPGIPTGFSKIDWLLGGFQAAKFYLLGARPGMGKTAWILNAATHAATLGIPVLGFSLEMLAAELVGRLLAALARVDGKAIERADLDQKAWTALVRAAGEISKFPMQIDEISGMTFDSIRSKARRWRMKHSAGSKALIFVDYIQLIQGAGEEERAENRQRELTRISNGLKDLSKELQCPIVALSQLNRGLENRPDKRPKQADLRESGALEQDADVICFLYRDDQYDPESEDRGLAEFIISKHRGGPKGTDKLVFLEQFTKFENMARE